MGQSVDDIVQDSNIGGGKFYYSEWCVEFLFPGRSVEDSSTERPGNKKSTIFPRFISLFRSVKSKIFVLHQVSKHNLAQPLITITDLYT